MNFNEKNILLFQKNLIISFIQKCDKNEILIKKLIKIILLFLNYNLQYIADQNVNYFDYLIKNIDFIPKNLTIELIQKMDNFIEKMNFHNFNQFSIFTLTFCTKYNSDYNIFLEKISKKKNLIESHLLIILMNSKENLNLIFNKICEKIDLILIFQIFKKNLKINEEFCFFIFENFEILIYPFLFSKINHNILFLVEIIIYKLLPFKKYPEIFQFKNEENVKQFTKYSLENQKKIENQSSNQPDFTKLFLNSLKNILENNEIEKITRTFIRITCFLCEKDFYLPLFISLFYKLKAFPPILLQILLSFFSLSSEEKEKILINNFENMLKYLLEMDFNHFSEYSFEVFFTFFYFSFDFLQKRQEILQNLLQKEDFISIMRIALQYNSSDIIHQLIKSLNDQVFKEKIMKLLSKELENNHIQNIIKEFFDDFYKKKHNSSITKEIIQAEITIIPDWISSEIKLKTEKTCYDMDFLPIIIKSSRVFLKFSIISNDFYSFFVNFHLNLMKNLKNTSKLIPLCHILPILYEKKDFSNTLFILEQIQFINIQTFISICPKEIFDILNNIILQTNYSSDEKFIFFNGWIYYFFSNTFPQEIPKTLQLFINSSKILDIQHKLQLFEILKLKYIAYFDHEDVNRLICLIRLIHALLVHFPNDKFEILSVIPQDTLEKWPIECVPYIEKFIQIIE